LNKHCPLNIQEEMSEVQEEMSCVREIQVGYNFEDNEEDGYVLISSNTLQTVRVVLDSYLNLPLSITKTLKEMGIQTKTIKRVLDVNNKMKNSKGFPKTNDIYIGIYATFIINMAILDKTNFVKGMYKMLELIDSLVDKDSINESCYISSMNRLRIVNSVISNNIIIGTDMNKYKIVLKNNIPLLNLPYYEREPSN